MKPTPQGSDPSAPPASARVYCTPKRTPEPLGMPSALRCPSTLQSRHIARHPSQVDAACVPVEVP